MLSSQSGQSSQSAWSKRLPVWLVVWAPALLLVAAVAVESETLFGADHTTGPLRALYESIHGPANPHHWWLVHLLIRKTCHLLGYGLVSAALFHSWWLTLLPRSSNPLPTDPLHGVSLLALRWKCHLLAIFCTVLVAAADEYHQTFLPNRSGSVWDVLIDGAGAIVAQLLIALGVAVWAHAEVLPKTPNPR